MERINLKEKEMFKKEGRGMANVVEHESKETFMAMHLSDERQMLFKKVETLIDGMPEPHFFEVVASCRK